MMIEFIAAGSATRAFLTISSGAQPPDAAANAIESGSRDRAGSDLGLWSASMLGSVGGGGRDCAGASSFRDTSVSAPAFTAAGGMLLRLARTRMKSTA